MQNKNWKHKMPLQSGFMIFFFNRSHTDFVYNDILVSCHDYIPSDFFTPLNNKDIYIYIYKKEKKKRIIAYI